MIDWNAEAGGRIIIAIGFLVGALRAIHQCPRTLNFKCIKGFLPAGENKNRHMAPYSYSKAAEGRLNRNIAFDLDSKNIRVNATAASAVNDE
jgi:NAD(P)-dependent dehydrogenase (short-subunit alcohol dehydrogenase family)